MMIKEVSNGSLHVPSVQVSFNYVAQKTSLKQFLIYTGLVKTMFKTIEKKNHGRQLLSL